jgi:LL-H family phage holin
MDYTQLINDLLVTLITVGVPLLIGSLFKLINAKIGTENMNKIEQEINNASVLAQAAVSYIQQKYPDLLNEEKKDKAVEWLTNEVNKYGINLTEEQIEGYLESALRNMKDAFGSEWGKSTK